MTLLLVAILLPTESPDSPRVLIGNREHYLSGAKNSIDLIFAKSSFSVPPNRFAR